MAGKKVKPQPSAVAVAAPEVEPSPRPAAATTARTRGGAATHARTHARFGWVWLFVALAFGTTLEGLNGFKAVEYLLDPLRRELWTLAHFHAAFLSLANLVYVRWADDEAIAPERRRAASRALVAGSVLLPAGFFLGGIAHPEGDPGVGIFAAPAGALLVLYAVGVHALAAWRR